MREIIERHLASKLAKIIINTLVVSFLVLWGMESVMTLSPEIAANISSAKDVINGFFLIEILLRIYVYRGQFFQKMFTVNMRPKKPLCADEPQR